MIKLKRLIAVLLTITLMLPSLGGVMPVFAASTTTYDYALGDVPGISFKALQDTYQLPSTVKEFITVGGKKLRFNEELYLDKGIFVYGDPTLVTGKTNDWSKNSIDPKIKYYNGGEYRYHGYTAEGNYYTNENFPNDATSDKRLDQKTWMYQWWEKKEQRISSWNDRAIKGNIDIQKQINQLLDFPIRYSTTQQSPNQVYNHLNVMTFSSTRFNGEGRMYHDAGAKDYYQTFSTEPIKNKKATPYALDVQILDKSSYAIKGADYVDIRIKYTGVLKDKDYYNDSIQKVIYYTREDVKKANVALNIGSQIINVDPSKHTLGKDALGHQTYYGTVTVKVKSSELANGFSVVGTSYLDYFDQTISNMATDSDDLSALPVDKRLGIDCAYVIPSIKLKSGDVLSASKILYQDNSIGDIVKYDFEIEGVKISSSGKPNASAIASFVYDEIRGEVQAMTPGKMLGFNTKQTVYDDKGNKKDYSVKFYVSNDPSVKVIEMDFDFPRKGFDIVPFVATNNTDMAEVVEKSVTIDGVAVDFDQFFSGHYIFGASDLNRPMKVKVSMTSSDGIESFEEKWITIYTTKPKAQLHFDGATKVNRKVTVLNDSETQNLNDPYLLQNYPNSYTYEYISEDGNAVKVKDVSTLEKQLLHKKPGYYEVKLTASNSLGRVSEPYTLKYYVLEDLKPNTIYNVWNNVLIRGEKLQYTLDVQSLDGDSIGKHEVTILFDKDNDGSYETQIAKLDKSELSSYSWTFNELGSYKLISYAEEVINPSDTIPEFLDGSEKITTTVEREFFIDNLRPVTNIDLDLPVALQSLDLFIIGSDKLDRAASNTIRDNKVNYANDLRLSGADALVNYWDTYTYRYDQVVNKQVNTGQTYPSNTYNYNENGYSGTLTIKNVVNNPYTVNEGYYTSETEAYTVTKYCQVWVCANLPPEFADGCAPFWGWWETQPCGTTTEYRDVSVWHDNYVQKNNYTAYYEGTVSKFVKQDYTNPFRTSTDRYVLVVSDANGITKADYDSTAKKATFKTIFVGTPSEKASKFPTADYFVDITGKTTAQAMDLAMTWIKSKYAMSTTYLMLKGTPFNISDLIYDSEGDAITDYGFQYVHEQIFDNPEGMESFAKSSLIQDASGFSSYKATTFNKVGKYTIYRWLKDSTSKPDFDKTSNLASVSVLVHRKPIADFGLDWDFDATTSTYKTTWIDKGYDLDHQFSDAEKGIRDRDIMYRQTDGANTWIYGIPGNLAPGTYELKYTVKDIEGAWSDPTTKIFTLAAEAPMQFKAELQSKVPGMSLNKFTIGNDVEWYDVWSRFPYAHHLEISLWDGGSRVTAVPIKTVNYTEGVTAAKSGNDYTWNNISYNIPKGANLQVKTYQVKIEAISNSNSANKSTITRNVTLISNTPPSVSFKSTAPAAPYEGDDITNIVTPSDPDGDKLTVQYYLQEPGGSYQLKQTFSNLTSGQDLTLPKILSASAGQYMVKVVVNDGNGGTAEAEKPIWVNQISVAATLSPSDPMAGDALYFTVTTTGYVDRVEIILEPSVITNDQRVAMGYTAATYVNGALPLDMDDTKLTDTKTLRYIIWCTTPQSVTLKNVRNRAPYTFTVRAWKGTKYRDYIITRDIKGDVRQLLKPGIGI